MAIARVLETDLPGVRVLMKEDGNYWLRIGRALLWAHAEKPVVVKE